ncbi:hypothetical protein [Lederbergia lenta]|uniref:hypothetical protein n=1 Tax=Lederbergia lenta TaxID=1467 RepID=UPI00203BBDB1|nr:hypothetical protein [Lederbergia lenta]MCM3110015.1 hypothetical protein [Lederbergia lenta]
MLDVKFEVSEVISYIEEKSIDGVATSEEDKLYEEYIWNGTINKLNYKTFNKAVKEMKRLYEGM